MSLRIMKEKPKNKIFRLIFVETAGLKMVSTAKGLMNSDASG